MGHGAVVAASASPTVHALVTQRASTERREAPIPSECASIGVSPGQTDNMYNAGTVGHCMTDLDLSGGVSPCLGNGGPP